MISDTSSAGGKELEEKLDQQTSSGQKKKNYKAGALAGLVSGCIGGFALYLLSFLANVLILGERYDQSQLIFFLFGDFDTGILFYGIFFSIFYVWLYDKLPTTNAIIKAEILVLFSQLAISVLSIYALHTNNWIYEATTLPAYAIIAFLLGYFYPAFRKRT